MGVAGSSIVNWREHIWSPSTVAVRRAFIPFSDFVEIIDKIIYPKDHALTSTGYSL